MPDALFAIRRSTDRLLLALIWAHIPVVLATGLALGKPFLTELAITGGLAAFATVVRVAYGTSLTTHATVAVALVGMPSLMVLLFAGHAWQIDLHMYFFAALALTAAYADWRVILAAAATIALHHLTLNFVLPAAVFPGGADFGRVVLHAVIVVLESAVLIWGAFSLQRAVATSAAARAAAETARAEVERLAAERRQFEADAEAQRKAWLSDLVDQFDAEIAAMLRVVATSAVQLNGTAESMHATATRSSAQATAVAIAAEQASGNVQTVAAASEELAASIREIGQQVDSSQSIAGQAVSEAERTNATVRRLVDSAQKIGEVTALIETIAAQTNLLALNATIEAARAGEAGKGFAVVASEVKNLATQTAKATEQIASQIQAMQSISSSAATAIAGIGTTIADMDGITAGIAAAVEEQNAATAEIARSVTQAASGTAEVTGGIAEVNEAAARTGAAASQLLTASEELASQADMMQTRVTRFLAQVKAA